MAAGKTSVPVKTMHEFMTVWNRALDQDGPKPGHESLPWIRFRNFQASQIHRLAPNALRRS